jgi:NADH dehydrogenase FAD-containing subunit
MSAIPNLPSDTPGIHTNGITNRAPIKSSFKLNDSPVENLRPLKVVVIGAGYSGIYCGIRIPERLRNVELVIYEKNAGVGGTWYENRYARLNKRRWRVLGMSVSNITVVKRWATTNTEHNS